MGIVATEGFHAFDGVRGLVSSCIGCRIRLIAIRIHARAIGQLKGSIIVQCSTGYAICTKGEGHGAGCY